MDETYIKVKGQWNYLYRAVDLAGNTLDFLLTGKRDGKAVKRFFYKALKATHNQQPRVGTVDKNPAYPKAMAELKAKQALSQVVWQKLSQTLSIVLRVTTLTLQIAFPRFFATLLHSLREITKVLL